MGCGQCRWIPRIHACWTQFDVYGSKEPGDSTTILCSFANARGKQWSEPVRVSDVAGDCLDGDDTAEGAVPAVGVNGEIFVAWARGPWIYFDKSLDGGQTWGADRIVADIAGGWDQSIPGIGRVNGMPVTCVDTSDGPHRGRIYINWTDTRNGDTDVWMTSSDDAGATWSTTKRVNTDGPDRDQFFTWMTVDPFRGDVHVVFTTAVTPTIVKLGQRTSLWLRVSTEGTAGLIKLCLLLRSHLRERCSSAITTTSPRLTDTCVPFGPTKRGAS